MQVPAGKSFLPERFKVQTWLSCFPEKACALFPDHCRRDHQADHIYQSLVKQYPAECAPAVSYYSSEAVSFITFFKSLPVIHMLYACGNVVKISLPQVLNV